MIRYKLHCNYTDNDEKHSCVETWKDLNEQDLLKHVIEYLDILHHDNVPYMLEFEQIRKNFSQFGVADENTIIDEYNRLVIGYDAYNLVVWNLSKFKSDMHSTTYSFSVDVDEQMSLEITAFSNEVQNDVR